MSPIHADDIDALKKRKVSTTGMRTASLFLAVVVIPVIDALISSVNTWWQWESYSMHLASSVSVNQQLRNRFGCFEQNGKSDQELFP